MKRKSTPQRIWAMLRSRKPGSKFHRQTLIDNLPNSTPKAVSACLTKMRKRGALKVGVGRGNWIVTDKMADYGQTLSFRPNYNGKAKSIRVPVKPSKPRSTAKPKKGVLEDLLSALAAAESEIRRLMALDAKVKELTRE